MRREDIARMSWLSPEDVSRLRAVWAQALPAGANQ